MLSSSDARSANSTDATYRTSYTLDAFGDVLTATTPKPAGQTAAPVTTNTISLGTETAADTSTVPVGLLLKTVGPRGEVTTYAYNHNGDLASRTDPSGLRTTYTYDGWGRQTIVSTYSGTTPIGTTSTTYDATGHPLVVTYPATTDVVTGKAHQLRVTNTYDNDGNLLSASAADADAVDATRTTTYAYTAYDQLSVTTLPDGNKETKTYNLDNDVASVTDPTGTVTSYTYDQLHNLLSTTVTAAGADPTNGAATSLVVDARQYDNAGLLTTDTDAQGRVTTYSYYPDQTLQSVTAKSVSNAAGSTHDVVLESDVRDGAGNITSQTNQGVTSAATYDPAGNPATTTLDPAGLNRVTTYSYDGDSEPLTVSQTGAGSPGITKVTSFTYDAAGKQLTVTVHNTGGTLLTTTTVRDVRELPTKVTDPNGAATAFTYDALGQQTSVAAPAITTTVGGTATAGVVPTSKTGFNTFGEVAESTDANGNTTTNTINTRGLTISVALPPYTPPGGTAINAVAKTTYDPDGRVTATTDPLGHTTAYKLDPYGDVLTATDPAVGTNPAGVTTYTV